jgi:CubicO group peptidase (beta-lactamase class C family)
MHRTPVLLASLLSTASVAGAQTPGLPLTVERYIKSELARQRIPGLSVAILRGDSALLARGYGYADLEHQVKASDSTVYQVGSVTKQFTAAAIVMLSEQGRLGLDDPITKYLPEGSSVWQGVTIRHLLTHTSGIPEYSDSTFDWRRDYSEEEMVRLAANHALVFAPGDSESYSSTGYALLGVIIHRVTGFTWGAFLREKLFRPLGMRSARVNSYTDIIPNRAAGYQLVNDSLKNQEWYSPTISSTADLGLSVSVRDLAQWIIGLDRGKVLSPAGLEASYTPVRLNSGVAFPYGFGWQVTQQRGYRRIGHTGTWQGFLGTIQRYPDFGLTVIVLANFAEAKPEGIAFGIAGLIEPALSAPHLLTRRLSGASPPHSIDRLLGDVASGKDSGEVTPELRTVTPASRRERIGGWLKQMQDWRFLGCDAVSERRISRLGAKVHQICYARGSVPQGSLLFTILYDAEWRAAGIDLYVF